MCPLKDGHKVISHFATISPQVDINALVMDLAAKAPEVTCCLSAINIGGLVYVYCDINEGPFMESIFVQIDSKLDAILCVIFTARLSPCLLRQQPRCCTSQLRVHSALIVSTHVSAHAHTCTSRNLQAIPQIRCQAKQKHTKIPYICAKFHFCSVESVHVTALQMF